MEVSPCSGAISGGSVSPFSLLALSPRGERAESTTAVLYAAIRTDGDGSLGDGFQ